MITVSLAPDLEQAALAEAKRRGIPVQELTAEALRALLIARTSPPAAMSHGEWKRKLARLGVDCGVSLPDAALTSEALYD
jgi:hypothetical protein